MKELLFAALAAASMGSHAQELVQCIGPDGSVTFTDMGCATTQERATVTVNPVEVGTDDDHAAKNRSDLNRWVEKEKEMQELRELKARRYQAERQIEQTEKAQKEVTEAGSTRVDRQAWTYRPYPKPQPVTPRPAPRSQPPQRRSSRIGGMGSRTFGRKEER